MLKRLRFVLFIALAALGGALAGRVAAEARRKSEAGEDPASIDFAAIRVRPQDLVPGLVAAVRVHDQPWSWLHIPSWLAAFGVNFGVSAVGGDLSQFREMAEQAAFRFAGIELPGDDDLDIPATTTAADRPAEAVRSTTWTAQEVSDRAPEPPPTGFTPFRD